MFSAPLSVCLEIGAGIWISPGCRELQEVAITSLVLRYILPCSKGKISMLVVGLHYHISQWHKIKGVESVHLTDNVWRKVEV